MLSVYAVEKSEIYGHGKRAVIWFAGCTLRCEGCINRHLWQRESGSPETVESLLRMVSMPDVSGVTLIGGEPLDQDAELLDFIRASLLEGLDVVLFTGYEPHELDGWRREAFDLCAVTVTGRYVEELRDTHLLLRGSSNQRITVKDEALKKYYAEEARQVEVVIGEDGLTFLGFPEDFLENKYKYPLTFSKKTRGGFCILWCAV